MNMILGFLSSDFWKDIQNRVVTTFSMSIVGTVANASNPEILNKVTDPSLITELIEVFTLISYGISILVGCTVLFRFFYWLKDKNKKE